MTIQVKIPAVLRPHVAGAKELEATGSDVRGLLASITSEYPSLTSQLFASDEKLHRFVNVYVNDEDVRYLNGLDTPVSDGDIVAILPAVAGGA